ncbi:MAG: AAA family ATPase [Parvibaculum sp.]|uniref:AAA family ATPase n=1 Tax=Parvibaculum sp. TaxID=2024848 RepID=UPI002ABB75F6|nr:AAA family ATPase [Parvibaculum sp.]MDZ4382936.1 AAA family ATPase [Parvibaculum sp.]
MRIEKPNFYAVTGGPGAGKTTLIETLAALGFGTVEEAGRRIIREQNAKGGKATHDGDRLAYRDLMFDDAIRTFERMRTESGPVFFDRGLPDLIGYSLLNGTPVPKALAEAVRRYRYNGTVLIAPPWREIYGQDEERGQDFTEAVATHEAIREAYIEAGYELFELPMVSVEARVNLVLRWISSV